MESIISEFINKGGEYCITIGSHEYLEKVKKEQCKQIISVLLLHHSQDDWDYMIGLSEDELYFALTQYMKNNIECIVFVN